MASRLACPACGAVRGLAETSFECACGDLLDVVHDLPAFGRALFDERCGGRAVADASGVWRFRELVLPDLPSDAIVTRREGGTPLYADEQVGRYAGVAALVLKHEGMNPSGSFKDRGMTVAVSHARRLGFARVACASTGNTSASLAAYAAAAGMQAVVVAPEGQTSAAKISQALAYGARTLLVRGDFDAGLALLRANAAELGLYLLNSINPFRIEGQKTIVLELLQDLGWEPPDWIVFPAGNLGNCAAFGKALREARAVGLIERHPRLAAVQASGASPFAAAFRRAFDELAPVRAETIATAIRIGNPVSYRRAVRSIRESQGVVTDVSDAEILAAKAVVDRAGIGAEPASCASLAGVRKLVELGVIERAARVACILTGHLLKDPDTTLRYHRGELAGIDAAGANRPISIDARREALRAAIEDLA